MAAAHGETELHDAWEAHVVAARAQTLEDVAVAESAAVAVLVGSLPHAHIERAMRDDALERGFAVTTASLAKHAFHELDAMVGAFAAHLEVPGVARGRRHGLALAVEAFGEEHGRRAEEELIARADAEALSGELRVLVLDALAVMNGRHPSRRLHTWLGGRDVRAATEDTELRPLTGRTAKRGLVQLTRLVRVLGFRGLRVILSDADALPALSKARREVAYTVLRELIDNADGRHGMVATEILLFGTRSILDRVSSVYSHPALASRLRPDADEGGDLPVPHRQVEHIDPPEDAVLEQLTSVPTVRPIGARHGATLNAHLRLLQGLPPAEALSDLSIRMEEIERRVQGLLEHASRDSSVFAMLTGDYGAGKTHHLLHLEAQALADERPVLRLSVERLDEDLGNPQRHLRRLLEDGVLPLRRRASPFDRLDAWLASPTAKKRLRRALDEVVETVPDAARAATRALRDAPEGSVDDHVVHTTLTCLDIEDKPGAPTYRRDAYSRLHLWLELLARLEGCEAPVIIIDEAENLYRAGVSRAERRTALRSLAFYCGGNLPRACVVLAVTPATIDLLREEAEELLGEIEDQATSLVEENVTMLRHRLLRTRPIRVEKLRREDLDDLARRAYTLGSAIGNPALDIDEAVTEALTRGATPREVLQRMSALLTEARWRR
jgi:hypothetical protein